MHLEGWLRKLLTDEEWPLTERNGRWEVEIYGNTYPAVHPAMLHLRLYRDSGNPDIKFEHLKAAHDYIWPKEKANWHYWTERRFRVHCENYQYVTLAGGGSEAKSYDAAKLLLLWWMANPEGRCGIVMSTTLESLNSRIYGYVLDFVASMEVDFPLQSYNEKPARILYKHEGKYKDYKHCITALSAKHGDTSNTIQNLIGRHPKDGLMVVLDEGPDLPVALLEAVPNWATAPWFQLWCIGNSSSIYDLHGSLATPRGGWNSIDRSKDFQWETSREGGICLYFNPFDSPAIHETDPERKERLGRFLWTEKKLIEAEKLYNPEGEQYWRMVLGFWKSDKTENVVISRRFVDECNVDALSEWAPNQQLELCGGLDIAMSTGGDKCILRLAVIGWDTLGKRVMDFRKEKLIYQIEIKPLVNKSAEIQIAEQVLQILNALNVPLGSLALDANGQGRAVGEVIRLQAQVTPGVTRIAKGSPIKVYSVRRGQHAKESFDVTIKTPYDLWSELRTYVQAGQIRGLDEVTIQQITTRQVLFKNGAGVLEQKKDYKNRMRNVLPSLAHSPDEADAAALALQAAIMSLGFAVGQKREVTIEGMGKLEIAKLHAAIQSGAYKPISQRQASQVQGFNYGNAFQSDMNLLGKRSSL